MTQDLGNKTAIVTGAAHGIGAAIAARLASDGARVLMTDIEEDALNAAARNIDATGERVQCFVTNVRERAAVAAMVDHAVGLWGKLDIQVSNAGIVDREPFLQMSDDLWERVLSTNLSGAFYCGQHAARQMVSQGTGGRIVHVTSNSGVFGGRGRAAYGASKAALINLTQTMAIELAEHAILVNAVAPGPTRTRAVGDAPSPAPSVSSRMPLARFGEPREIAAVAAFLASDECSFTTGHVFCADGGFTVAGVMEG